MKLVGPDTKYMMQWMGAWRPVTNLFDQHRIETTLALRASIAVIFIAPGAWVTTLVTPGDLVERVDRDPKLREWDYID